MAITSNVETVLPHPLDFRRDHPLISIVWLVGLNISINSSLAPFGPRVLNSLIKI